MRFWRRLLWIVAIWRVLGPVVVPRWRPPQEHPWRVPGRTVFVGDSEFLVRQTGPQDAPHLVLIHGLGGSSLAEWYETGRRLAERYRLTLIDHRSHGLSPKVTGRFEIADVADDVAAVMTAVGIGRSHVVGYSMGGAIAQALAHRHPSRVDRMVLVATMAAHPPGWRESRVVGTWLVRAWERLTGLGTPEVRWGYLAVTGAVAVRHRRWMWSETHRRDPEAGAAATFALLRFDSSEWLGRLEHETLVVIPTSDQLVPVAWQRHLASRLSNATVVEIEGARHELPWTHAERLVTTIEGFVGDEGA